MIQYIEGDIFSSPAQVIVNTVNGKGSCAFLQETLS